MRERLIRTLALLLIGVTAAFAGETHFNADLTAAQETHAVTSPANGIGAFVLADGQLNYRVTVENLSSAITAAEFHQAKLGADGDVVKTITADFDGNTAAGVWTSLDSEPFTEAMMKELLEGHLYINIKTVDHPEGEIRGQVKLNGGAGLHAHLNADQEFNGSMSGGEGTAILTLTDAGLVYRVTVNDLDGEITAAHFHDGDIGVNGSPVKTITADFEGNTAVGVWLASDSEPLTDEMRAKLLTGKLYLNVHTSVEAAGEVRGQVKLADGEGYVADLSSMSGVSSDARGTAVFTMTSEGLVYGVQIEGNASSATELDLRNSSGETVNTISIEGNSAFGVWSSSDAEGFDQAQVSALINGELEVVVATEDHAEGELSGMIESSGTMMFTTKLSGDQEAHAVSGSGSGFGWVKYTQESNLQYKFVVDGLTGAITAAHFHNAAIGVEGGIVKTLEFSGNVASGTWTAVDAEPLTQAMLKAALAGSLYVNVHTADNPQGELRGQLELTNGVALTGGAMSADQVTADVASSANGTISIVVTPIGAIYSATAAQLSGSVAAAGFSMAEVGMDGELVKSVEFDGNSAFGVWSTFDAQPYTQLAGSALLRGRTYLNVSTAAHAEGELRGQAQLAAGIAKMAAMTSGQVVGDVSANAQGTATFTLTAAGVVYSSVVNDLSGAITSSAIYEGEVGMTGPIQLSLDFAGGLSVNGIWGISSDAPFGNSQADAYMNGDLYMQVATAANAEGESRGQIADQAMTTGVAEEGREASLPATVTLQQNYPNPFNPSTTIAFVLPSNGRVTLSIYNTLGEEVAELVDGRMTSGLHQVTFHAADLPSGVYFYRLETSNASLTRKMMLMK